MAAFIAVVVAAGGSVTGANGQDPLVAGQAITKSLLESRGIDTSRLVVVNVVTVEEFRGKASQGSRHLLKKT